MHEKRDSRLAFTDGFVVAKDNVVVSSCPISLADYDFARVCRIRSGKWSYFDLDRKVYSICVVTRPIPTVYCLGRDGRVHIKSPQGTREEEISDAGVGGKKLGYVTKIREIAGTLYVCGVAGQVYRRGANGWAHFDEGVLDPQGPPKALDLYNIDGTSERDIYAVGQRGLVWHYDGSRWMKIESPTNQSLEALRCVSARDIYVAGYKGEFLRFDGERWEGLSDPQLKLYFSSVEVFQGKVYLAAEEGIFCFDGRKTTAIDTGLKPIPDGRRLHANDDVLWSFGADHLCFFDGKKWTYVKHPDNPL